MVVKRDHNPADPLCIMANHRRPSAAHGRLPLLGGLLLATVVSAAGAGSAFGAVAAPSATASPTPTSTPAVDPRLVAAQARLAQLQATLDAAQAAATEAHTRTTEATEGYQAAAAAAGAAQAEVTRAERAREALQAVADQARAARGRLARDAYQSGGLSGLAGLAAVLVSDNPSQMRDRLVQVSRATRNQTLRLTAAQEQGELAARREQRTIAAAQALATARSSASDTLARMTAAEATEKQAVAALSTALAEQQDAVQDVEGVRTQSAVGSLGPVLAGPGSLLMPADDPVTSPFGMRVHPVTGVRKPHTGTDFGVPCGTPVEAAADGTVHSSGWNTAYGNRLIITHPALGIATTYNHLTQALVTEGQRVTRGQVIAISGTTGYSTGCHLHFEVVAGGSYVDPMPFVTR